MARIFDITLVFCSLAVLAVATRTGDEFTQVDVGGLFYVFSDAQVTIVDPVSLLVVANLTTDSNGQPLTNTGAVGSTGGSRTWNDPGFLQDTAAGLSLVCVNEGDVYMINGAERSYVSCIDTKKQQFVSRIEVGSTPVHIYVIDEKNEFWSHSDGDGLFYVYTASQAAGGNSVSTALQDAQVAPAHGKLVIDPWLYPVGYGSNVDQQRIPRWDFTTATITDNINYGAALPDPSLCQGTHTIVYSNKSQHLYAECADDTGILEYNVLGDTFVALHTNITGTVTMSPANDRIFVVETGSSIVNILTPSGNGVPATTGYTITVPGNPNYPEFYSNASALEDAGAYTVYFPLTRVTNVNNIRAAAAAGGNVLDPGYANQPTDCAYGQADGQVAAQSINRASSKGLRLANGTDGTPSTPSCGSCAPGVSDRDPSQFDSSLSGFAVVDFELVELSAEQDESITAQLVPAGSVYIAPNGDTDANQCSYGYAYRRAYRGGAFVAITADFPQPSIYIVDASAAGHPLYGRGWVGTSTSPLQLIWAPSS